ncbi:MAG: NTP transferase domain-containing protein [Abitibacteriaceae bacterium]|nr:NTP transferase domain-containing protein [Abditibacteriaceae bacterium]
MQAIILAGGMGTRLRPLTYTIPKPMLPVAGIPALAHIIHALEEADCREVLVTTNYLADVVSDGLKAQNFRIPVRCITEQKPLGTAGCVKNAIDQLDEEFLVIQGDAVSDMRYGEFIDFHHANNADVSIAVMRVQDTREFGIVAINEEQRIQRFQEKPRPEEAFSNLANSGFYLVKRSVFDSVPKDEPYDFSRQLFPRLMSEGARFFAWEFRGYWVDIGRVQNYLDGNLHLIKGKAEIAPGVHIPESATLVPPFLVGEGTHIGASCVIGPGAIIASGCVLGAGTNVSGSVLHQNVWIGQAARLNDCVVAAHSRLGDSVSVEPMSIIGESCDIGSNTQVCAHSRVGPVTPVAPGTVVDGVVSPRLDKLESLQRTMSLAPAYKDLPHDQLIVCALLAVSGEMTARSIAASAEIPFSRVHSVLTPLESRGVILSTLDVPKRYALTGDDVRTTS